MENPRSNRTIKSDASKIMPIARLLNPERRSWWIMLLLPVAILLLLFVPAFCQPTPPPIPAAAASFWTLEAPPWKSFSGRAARAFTNLNVVPSWDYEGTALSVATNVPAFLQLDVFENGRTNINLTAGSLEIWCQGNWTSVADGGTGPGAWATLWDIGSYTRNASIGAWLLAIDPSGSNSVWVCQSGGSNQFLSTSIDFDAGDFHEIVVTWSETNSCLYVDGELATNAGPIFYGPSALECSNDGFCVGSLCATGTNAGTNQFQGQLQWLVSYAYPLSADEVADEFATVADYIASFGYSVPGAGAVGGAGGFHPGDDLPGFPGGGGSGTNGTGSDISPNFSFTPPAPISNTDYSAYNEFYLAITNNATNAFVSVGNTLSNLTYVVMTNGSLANSNGWNIWQILLASNSVTPAPPIALNSNAPLFFNAALVSMTGTNGLPDWWCMEYFHTLNVDTYADPDGDLLCNLDEYNLGTDPTNPNSVSLLHNDAQALILAYTNFDGGCTYGLFVSDGPDTNTTLVTISNTVAGASYQIYSHDETDTNNTWIVESSFIGSNIETTVAITLNGRTLDYVGGYAGDSDGDGLPDGYEVIATLTDPYLPDTGLTGTPDGYKDPDGDGYSNLQEMYNQTNPHVFNTPAGAQDLIANYSGSTNTIAFSWQAASGPVLGYVISAYNWTTGTWDTITNNLATQLTATVTNPSDYTYSYFGITDVAFTVQAIYGNGVSTANANNGTIDYVPAVGQSALAHGPGGKTYLLASILTTNVTSYTAVPAFLAGYYPEFDAYEQPQGYDPTSSWALESNVYISSTQFTNGVAALTDVQEPPYAEVTYDFLTPVLSGNGSGDTTAPQAGIGFDNVPYFDGTVAMKQNISFLLRGASSFSSFSYSFGPSSFDYPTNYVYSSYYYQDGYAIIDHFAPFEDNYFYRNFAFASGSLDANGTSDNGWEPWSIFWGYIQDQDYTAFEFPTYSYVFNSNQPPTALLASDTSQYAGYFGGNYLPAFGVYNSGSLCGMSNYYNIYGLPYLSLELVSSSGSLTNLSPGTTVSGSYYFYDSFYTETAQPSLETVDYYFARPNIDPMPGQDGFDVTNSTPELMLGSVGNSMAIAGYAKQAVLNGNANVFSYLGQYFSNAFVMSNGIVTTNSAGILSEYGEFFPTVPGQVALQTMPDPDQGGTNGTCVVDIIRLSLDVNHDGTMDESYTGPDNTSYNNGIPFVFWANNDYDRWDFDIIDQIKEEDSVESTSKYAETPFSSVSVPDYDYVDGFDNRAIPCPRDLEDFARLWVSGVSNTLSRLPTGSTVTLSWAGNGNSPTIDLFQAADADGGIGYLTNLTTASNQINNALCQYVGRLGPGSNIVLNSSSFSNGWAGDHYIWCGVFSGGDQLNLTIYDPNSNVLAQSSQYIQIQDIKNMYERWTVGDTPGVPPQNVAVPAQDNLPPGTTTAFAYPYDPNYDTNDSYILSVHGYNIPLWEAERFSERAYKRLYWQGYTGRFGCFRWPAHSNFLLFDDDELSSWESGTGLYHLLYSLNAKYPGNVYLFAHSQGNMAAGQALLMAGTNQVVNTYIAAQAAVAVHTYDPTTPNRTPTPGTSFTTPDRYAQYWTNGAPPYFNGVAGASRYINFFNTNDWALTIPWPVNQDTKPDQTWKTFATWQSYEYNATNFQSVTGLWYNLAYHNLLFPTDTFSIYAYCDQAPCRALGAQPNVGLTFGVFNSRSQIELDNPPYNFAKLHIYHSGEFRSDNMQRWQFWNQVLLSYGLK